METWPYYSWQGSGFLKSTFRVSFQQTQMSLGCLVMGLLNGGSIDARIVRILFEYIGRQLILPILLTPNKDKMRPPTEEELKKMRESI